MFWLITLIFALMASFADAHVMQSVSDQLEWLVYPNIDFQIENVIWCTNSGL